MINKILNKLRYYDFFKEKPLYDKTNHKVIYDMELLHKNRSEIRSKIMFYLYCDLFGVATRKMRGISLNYDYGLLEVRVFFDSELTDEEEDEMIDIDNTLISSGYPNLLNDKNEIILNIKLFDTKFFIVPCEIDISDREGNLGWIFLRKEYV